MLVVITFSDTCDPCITTTARTVRRDAYGLLDRGLLDFSILPKFGKIVKFVNTDLTMARFSTYNGAATYRIFG